MEKLIFDNRINKIKHDENKLGYINFKKLPNNKYRNIYSQD